MKKVVNKLIGLLTMIVFGFSLPCYAVVPSAPGQDESADILKQIGEFIGQTVAHMGTLLYGTDMDPETQTAFYTLVGQCIAANVSDLVSDQYVINNAAARMHYDLYTSINTEQASTGIEAMSRSVPIHGNPNLSDPPTETNSVSVDSIINTTTITQDTAQQARNFISFISQLAEPLQQPYSADEVAKGLKNDQEMQQFVTKLGAFASSSSVGLSNYNYFYYERLVQPGLGKAAGIYHFNSNGSKGNDIPDASPLQVDEFMAKRRVVDPQWYTFLAELPPAAIQRELTTVLAEIRYELYKQRILQEREICTLSAMQLSMSQYAVGRLVGSEQRAKERIETDEEKKRRQSTGVNTTGSTGNTGSTANISGGTPMAHLDGRFKSPSTQRVLALHHRKSTKRVS